MADLVVFEGPFHELTEDFIGLKLAKTTWHDTSVFMYLSFTLRIQDLDIYKFARSWVRRET